MSQKEKATTTRVKPEGKAEDQLFRLLCWAEEWGFQEALAVIDELVEIPKSKSNKDGRTRDFYAQKYLRWLETEKQRKAIEKQIRESLK